jgi:hypothetical protein
MSVTMNDMNAMTDLDVFTLGEGFHVYRARF